MDLPNVNYKLLIQGDICLDEFPIFGMVVLDIFQCPKIPRSDLGFSYFVIAQLSLTVRKKRV